MRGIRLSLFANLAGAGWSALIGLVVVPVYLKLLGIEAYSLIGLYLTLQSILTILDLGLSPTVNRELASQSRASAPVGEPAVIAPATIDLVRTLEVICLTIAVALAGAGLVAAALGATWWIRAEDLSAATVREAAMMMAVLAALQWPLGFYAGGMRGLHRHGLVNILQIAASTTAAGGGVLVLWLYSPTITAFWAWQISVAALRLFITRALFWRSLPAMSRPARLDLGGTRHVWRFAAGMSGITITAILLWNLDKVVLSRLLPLNLLGYYLLASQIAGAVSFAAAPVFNTIFPMFSALAARQDQHRLRETYHQMTQVMAVLVLPFATVLILFAERLIFLWTGDAVTAAQSAPILRFLVAGMAINAMMNLPYALQLGVGWTRLAVQINVALLVILVPALWFGTRAFGPTGAAATWFGLNAIYMAVGVGMTHRRVLPGITMTWFLRGVLWPAAVTIILVAGLRWVIEPGPSRASEAAQIGGVLLVAVTGTALAASSVRAAVFRQIGRFATPAAPGA